MTSAKTVIGLILIGCLCNACAVTHEDVGSSTMIQPGERPELSTDEAGLWMAMDKVENKLKTSGHVVTDPTLNRYVRDVHCKIVLAYCQEVRIYIVENPEFNAAMAPNGVMVLWTGMLLRTENEAQLAVVLGHEMAHYLQRHSLQVWRDMRNKMGALMFIQLAAMAAGQFAGVPAAGAIGPAAALITQGSIFAFTRDKEREADQLGLEMIAKAGYDPTEAPKIWEALVEERDADDDSGPLIFFSTHPTSEERIENLTSQAKTLRGHNERLFVGRDELRAVVTPMLGKLLHEEVHKREYARTEVLLNRLIQVGVGLAELYFSLGELYRLRAEEGDADKAVAAYRNSVNADETPAELYRSLGLVLEKKGDTAGARDAFTNYLKAMPEATDREMVQWYISTLK